MRFAELLELGPGNKLININDSVYEQHVDRWTRDMGAKRLFGYRKETRVEHFQEAVDTVYTALEAELQTADPRKIMSHPKWTLLIGCAKRNFPDHVAVYQPSPIEQTRVRRMIQNTLTTRIIANKIDLLDIIKKDKCDSVWTIGELAVSRLRYELLSASAARVHDRYMNELDSDWSTWYDWILRKEDGVHASGSVESSLKSDRRGFDKGIRGVMKARASGNASFAASGSVDASLDKTWNTGGFSHKLKGNLVAEASANGNASASARMSELRASASAGLDANASLKANIDYEVTYSCKVRGEYLRRLLGSEAQLFRGRAGGHAELAARASASASGFASVYKDNSESGIAVVGEGDSSPWLKGLNISAEGETTLAVVMKGYAGVAIAGAAEVELTGDLFAGATAKGNLSCYVNSQGRWAGYWQ